MNQTPQSRRELEEWIAMVGHELSSPATSLIGLAELLVHEQSESDRREMCELLVAEGRRLTTIIRDLRAFGQAEGGPFGVEPRPTDLRRVLEHAAMTARVDMQHPISLEVPEVLPLVAADAVRVQQVLANLISNAQKYTPSAGEVRLSARHVDDTVEISVADHGLGIPDSARPRLFEKFFRVDGEDRRLIAGSGLGLAICKDIVEAHGGRIGFDSPGPAAGTRFWFTLPVAQRSARPALAPDNPQHAPIPSTRGCGLRVLVVDDEPAIGKLVSRMLEADHTVVAVTSAHAALDQLRADQFDVIVSDLGIGPGLDGLELLALVRRGWPAMRFILATGSLTLDADAVRASGVDEVLTKPYRAANLRGALARLRDGKTAAAA